MQRCTERNQTRCKRGNSCSRTSNGRAASKRLPCGRRVDAGDSLERVTHFAVQKLAISTTPYSGGAASAANWVSCNQGACQAHILFLISLFVTWISRRGNVETWKPGIVGRDARTASSYFAICMAFFEESPWRRYVN